MSSVTEPLQPTLKGNQERTTPFKNDIFAKPTPDKVARLRKRPSRPSSAQTDTEGDWISEESSPAAVNGGRSAGLRSTYGSPSLRARKSTASLRLKQEAMKHSKRGQDEERWIALLERQNEELLSQISLLTKDLTQSDKKHKTMLRREQEEVAHLQQELREWTSALTEQGETHRRERAAFRSQLVDVRIHASKKEAEHQSRLASLHQDLATLAREKEAAVLRAKRSEQELQYAKRRNASLAEELLAKKTLELTVEGQQRYLLELSSALDRMQEEQGLASPVSQAATSHMEGLSRQSRPGSLDGHALTQEVFASLASTGSTSCSTRRLSRDSPTAIKRLFMEHLTSPADMPPSPPATTCAEQEAFYLPPSPASCIFQPSSLRHRRNTSLWAELGALQDEAEAESPSKHTSRVSTANTSTSLTSTVATEPVQLQVLMRPIVHIRGMALERATRVVLVLSAWLKFLIVLIAAFAFAVYEGPAQWRLGSSQSSSME
ncbi:hypothetical protein BCR37DRAFT_381165 [Protomyces lactucae-debilis]|uniref:Uncharacterized protein n=1 Tax=Protomyces lactucae-debilis TaxID=2754530 RepID=A0A1Y2F9A0_PROLT|nr:uncharacterized protein BCR37DRAFT_381165 [Protomyces lactucae-debilis]ORY80490.1 hypothetical protein BCR37DRAFT_381165 [Protomyces lactucae-debilis]